MNFPRLMEPVAICDLCGSNDFANELAVNEWHLVKCRRCDLVFTSPRFTEHEIAELYSETYYQTAEEYFRAQLRPPYAEEHEFARVLSRRLRKTKMRSLDVGCGTGALVQAFKSAGFRAQGIEPNAMAAEAGRRLGRDISSVKVSELGAGEFDCMTAFHVLEHTYSPRGFLSECSRALSDKGILVIEVPNYGSRPARRLKQDWHALYPDTHLYHFTPKTLLRLLDQTGLKPFSVVKVGGGGFIHGGESAPSTVESPLRPEVRTFKKALLESLWKGRELAYRIPRARRIIRFLFWQVLGQGEFLRVYLTKKPLS